MKIWEELKERRREGVEMVEKMREELWKEGGRWVGGLGKEELERLFEEGVRRGGEGSALRYRISPPTPPPHFVRRMMWVVVVGVVLGGIGVGVMTVWSLLVGLPKAGGLGGEWMVVILPLLVGVGGWWVLEMAMRFVEGGVKRHPCVEWDGKGGWVFLSKGEVGEMAARRLLEEDVMRFMQVVERLLNERKEGGVPLPHLRFIPPGGWEE